MKVSLHRKMALEIAGGSVPEEEDRQNNFERWNGILGIYELSGGEKDETWNRFESGCY
jgi:hypothetical protein